MADLTARRLIANIEQIRDELTAIRGRVEELDEQANQAHLSTVGALDASAGGLTCVIATLATAQEELRRA